MLRATRSELTRLNHRSFRVGWFGLTALLAAMFTTVVFQAASGGTPIPTAAPGGSFPTLAELTGPDGQVAGLGAAATILGVPWKTGDPVGRVESSESDRFLNPFRLGVPSG